MRPRSRLPRGGPTASRYIRQFSILAGAVPSILKSPGVIVRIDAQQIFALVNSRLHVYGEIVQVGAGGLVESITPLAVR